MINFQASRLGLAALVFAAAANVACAQVEVAPASATAPVDDAAIAQPYRHPHDPFESFNRRMFAFNDAADRWVLKPVARGYRWVTPQFLEDGIGNIFSNVSEVSNIFNNLLQGKVRDSGRDTSRLLINSTVGLLGFFDVASRWGLPPSNEDFGQTLGAWGVSSGPYLVLPLLGPRTLRDGLAMPVDGLTDPVVYIDDVSVRNSLIVLRVVDGRARLLSAEDMIRGDRYSFMRDAYLQRREFLVNDGVVEDGFGDDDDLDDWPAWDD